jgi:hypothetical protein
VRAWIDCQVHVKGRPDWLFVKLHTHGAVERDFDALFGELGMRMHESLNELCNDGRRYKLHYVTARQAYNLAKAAERGLAGDPQQWLDLVVDKPATHWYSLGVEHELHACSAVGLRIAGIAGDGKVLKTRVGTLRQVSGAFTAIAIDAEAGAIELVVPGAGELQLVFDRPVALEPATTVGLVRPVNAARDTWLLDVRAPGIASLRYDVHAAPAAIAA